MTRPDPAPTSALTLADRVDALLPQTQCTRCGYPDCRGYAEAIAAGSADINRCPPGGHEGVVRLSRLTGQPVAPLDAACGTEAPRLLAVIDEAWCIGCTLCIKACPVDCIVGAPKRMHTVLDEWCTGCTLCLPVCPVDCIELLPMSGEHTGWQAWSPEQAEVARDRYAFHRLRVARAQRENDDRLVEKARHKLSDLESASAIADPQALARKRAVVEAAMQRARQRRSPQAPRS